MEIRRHDCKCTPDETTGWTTFPICNVCEGFVATRENGYQDFVVASVSLASTGWDVSLDSSDSPTWITVPRHLGKLRPGDIITVRVPEVVGIKRMTTGEQ